MRTLEELRQFYGTDLAVDLGVLEAERKRLARKLVAIGVVMLLFLMLLAYTIPKGKPGESKAARRSDLSGAPFAASLILLPAAWVFIWNRLMRGYKRRFAEKILQRVVPFIDESLTYSRDADVPPELLKQSGIFNPLKGYYTTEDVISGKIGKTQVLFFELRENFNTMSTIRSQNRKSLFQGLFFIADFNKDFSGETQVLPGMGKTIAQIGPGEPRMQDAELEDPEFESHFGVTTTDQVEARYILSTSLMQRIVDFRKKAGKPVYLSFAGSKVFIAIPYPRELFEPPTFGTLLDFSRIEEYYGDVKFAEGIVEDLNLNTRIWGKQ